MSGGHRKKGGGGRRGKRGQLRTLMCKWSKKKKKTLTPCSTKHGFASEQIGAGLRKYRRPMSASVRLRPAPEYVRGVGCRAEIGHTVKCRPCASRVFPACLCVVCCGHRACVWSQCGSAAQNHSHLNISVVLTENR